MASFSRLHVLLATALAVIIVLLPMGHIVMAIPWMIVVAYSTKSEKKRGRGGLTFGTYVVVTLSVVIAAILAPLKTTERVLDRPMVLPKTELSIAEMNRETNLERFHFR